MSTRIASTLELRIVASHGRASGYNRQLSQEVLRGLDPEGIHVIEPLMLHEHANGKPVEPHLRCQVYLKEPAQTYPRRAIVDLEIEDVEALRLPQTV